MKTVQVTANRKVRLVGWILMLSIMGYVLMNILSVYFK